MINYRINTGSIFLSVLCGLLCLSVGCSKQSSEQQNTDTSQNNEKSGTDNNQTENQEPGDKIDDTEGGTVSDTAGPVGSDSELVYGSGDLMCSYSGEEPHYCACSDGIDNDSDGFTDGEDLHCFGPYDDDEGTYATGIPGDNLGAKGYTECPFDGNSGTGNDAICCNPEDPSLNVTPNGCDHKACCEVDLNGNSTGEFVGIFGACVFAPACGTDGKHGCACSSDENCDSGQYCIKDGNIGAGFCSTCQPCKPDSVCNNPCECGEVCFGGFVRPPEECGRDFDTDDGPNDTSGDDPGDTSKDDPGDTSKDDPGDTSDDIPDNSCPGGMNSCTQNSDCQDAFETCISGCCYSKCQPGITPCNTTSDCPNNYTCITGCCIQFSIV